MFDEQNQDAVPTYETPEAQGVSAKQTDEATTQQTPAVTTESQSLTKDDIAKIFKEQITDLFPQLDQRFATRDDLAKSAQAASDKRFARLMKELAPEIRSVDMAVKRGLMDEEQAKVAKREMFADKAAELAGKDEEPEPAPVQAPMPAPDQDRQMAMQWLNQFGLTVDEVPEVAPGKPLPPFQQFVALVTQRAADKKTAEAVKTAQATWQKDYEDKTKQVREADQKGATKPPTGGTTPIRKRTLADADHIGEIISDRLTKQ